MFFFGCILFGRDEKENEFPKLSHVEGVGMINKMDIKNEEEIMTSKSLSLFILFKRGQVGIYAGKGKYRVVSGANGLDNVKLFEQLKHEEHYIKAW